jgi:hypothetical protein
VTGKVERVTVMAKGAEMGQKMDVPAAGIHVAAMDEHQIGRIRFPAGRAVEYMNPARVHAAAS